MSSASPPTARTARASTASSSPGATPTARTGSTATAARLVSLTLSYSIPVAKTRQRQGIGRWATGAVGDGAASGIVGRIAAMEAQLLMARGASRAKLPADSDAAAAGHVEQALADFDASLGTHRPFSVCW